MCVGLYTFLKCLALDILIASQLKNVGIIKSVESDLTQLQLTVAVGRETSICYTKIC